MEGLLEQQQEELEVLQSIYEGDTKFKQISPTCFQYMYGEEEQKSILVEISWPQLYPSVLPSVNLGSFFYFEKKNVFLVFVFLLLVFPFVLNFRCFFKNFFKIFIIYTS